MERQKPKDGPRGRIVPRQNSSVSRRQFIKAAGAGVAAFTIMKPEFLRGTQANSKIKLGLVGCGGRGIWIAGLFAAHGGYEISAAADCRCSRSGSLTNSSALAYWVAAGHISSCSTHRSPKMT